MKKKKPWARPVITSAKPVDLRVPKHKAVKPLEGQKELFDGKDRKAQEAKPDG